MRRIGKWKHPEALHLRLEQHVAQFFIISNLSPSASMMRRNSPAPGSITPYSTFEM